MEEQIKEIIKSEFSILISNIESDFHANCKKKIHNFLLTQFSQETIKYMVFVSSFESKSGNVIERCARHIARLKYGEINVPTIVNPNCLSIGHFHPTNNNQYIATKVNLKNGRLSGTIAEFRDSNKGDRRATSNITQDKIQELYALNAEYSDGEVCLKPVDLAYFDGNNWNLVEIKAGGDLDTSNAPSNISKLLLEYVAFGVKNTNIYFATFYNKNGEGNTWTGIAKNYLNYPNMFLIGSQFWNKILPSGITFESFIQIYKTALSELDLNKRINDLINKV